MTFALASINPFLAARFEQFTPLPQLKPDRSTEPERPVYAKLPRAPKNASPVPHLTSLYHNSEAGNYGSRSYPGNCGGNLIKDLLLYFRPAGMVFDPMSGSGTCRDVCEELELPCIAWDIHDGFDACDPHGFPSENTFAFIWAHPAYWRQKLYADDPRDLSRASTLEDFLRRYGQFLRNCARALKPGGKLAVLMGDYSDREAGFVPLTYYTKHFAFAAGLRQHGTDIIRFSHGASSSKKVYRSSFIPGLHDVCMIFEKQSQLPTEKGNTP
jgi:SAM-dependent methyltransferase